MSKEEDGKPVVDTESFCCGNLSWDRLLVKIPLEFMDFNSVELSSTLSSSDLFRLLLLERVVGGFEGDFCFNRPSRDLSLVSEGDSAEAAEASNVTDGASEEMDITEGDGAGI